MSQTTLPERVLEWTKTYCDSLTENYKQHSVRMHTNYTSDWSKIYVDPLFIVITGLFTPLILKIFPYPGL